MPKKKVEEKEVVETVVEETSVEPTKKRSSYSLLNDQLGTFSDDIIIKKATALSENDKIQKAYNSLLRYSKDKELLWGTVIGLERQSNKVLIVVSWNEVKVVIPEEYFFEKHVQFSKVYDSMKESEKANVRRKVAGYYIGAIIPFTVESVSKDKEVGTILLTAIGNRVHAMEIIRDIYFYHKNRKITDMAPRSVEKDDIIKARVLNVRENSVLVECAGVETRLNCHHLTNTEVVDNCCDYVAPGDELTVKVIDSKIEEDRVYLYVTGRLIDTTREIRQMNKDSVYLGKVDKYNSEKHSYSVVLSNGVLALVPENKVVGQLELCRGDKVLVHVETIVRDEFVVGTIIKN